MEAIISRKNGLAPIKAQLAAAASADTVVECRGVWKIFGKRSVEVLEAMRSGTLDKVTALEKFGSAVAVAEVNLSIARGEIFCIMGLSGSGKSTLLRHINRLVEPTAGEIVIDGESIGGISASQLRKLRNEKIGMVFQHVALLPHRTVIDNAAFGLEARGVKRQQRRAQALEKLALVGLEQWAERYPRELSGGMQQRVGLARALASDPTILLMDEPFSALDPVIRRDLQNQFLSLTRMMKKTTIFITHDLEEAMRLGTRIAVMRDARIVQVGTPEEIFLRPADKYVTDFVRGISPQSILKAKDIMRPVQQSGGNMGEFLAEKPVSPDDRLGDLIARMADRSAPIPVHDGQAVIGVITTTELFKALASK